MAYKAVIFDLDGTLLDTLDDLTASTNAALTAHGLPPHTTDEVRRFVGNGYARLIAQAVPTETDDTTKASVHAAFMAHYAEHGTHGTMPYAGVPEMLAALRDAAVPCAVVSNKGDTAVHTLADHYFPGTFVEVVGERDGVRRKPAPDALEAVMAKLGLLPADVVYVGDSEVDVATAANAGVDCIAVTWGFREVDVLRRAGAAAFAHTCDELLARILT